MGVARRHDCIRQRRSVVASYASLRALRAQASLHARVLHETAERARAESEELAARANEARFRQLVEQSPEAIILHRGAQVEYVNPATLRLFAARAPSDVVGHDLATWVEPDDHAALGARLARLRAGEAQTIPTEYRIRALDGEHRVVEATSVLIVSESRTVFQTVLRDVTDRKRLGLPRRAHRAREPRALP